jgi:hypothetical protein
MSGILMGNLLSVGVASVTLSPALIVLNTTAEQTFTVPGLKVGDFVNVNKPTAQAGLGIVGCRVTAANTLGITFSNNTGSSITPTASETYLVSYCRPESVQAGVVA